MWDMMGVWGLMGLCEGDGCVCGVTGVWRGDGSGGGVTSVCGVMGVCVGESGTETGLDSLPLEWAGVGTD